MILIGADLSRANCYQATFTGADATEAQFSEADLQWTGFQKTKLKGANLCKANLIGANLGNTDLADANITDANLEYSSLIGARLTNCTITGCKIYGVSAWDVETDQRTRQSNLVITNSNEYTITVDNLEVAQFMYLLLHNEKIRNVIDTITSKVVLILGRFTSDRKAVLDALREELRGHNYLPVLFDFPETESRDLTETVSLLARVARFIIADLTNPSSIPKDLETIIPNLAVPVQPIIECSARPFAMFKDSGNTTGYYQSTNIQDLRCCLQYSRRKLLLLRSRN